jgi:transposase InsO family protein
MGEGLQVSRSGFYADVPRQASADGGAEAAALLTRVQAIAAGTRHTEGSRRMAQPRQDDGCAVGRDNARRLMRHAKLTGQRRKPRQPVTTESRHGYTVAPNLWARQFAVAKPNPVWGGAITLVWTAEGWWYLGVRLAWSSRTVVGWALSQRVEAAFVQEALPMAWGRRQPTAGLIHHSDRGSQYACGTYQLTVRSFLDQFQTLPYNSLIFGTLVQHGGNSTAHGWVHGAEQGKSRRTVNFQKLCDFKSLSNVENRQKNERTVRWQVDWQQNNIARSRQRGAWGELW